MYPDIGSRSYVFQNSSRKCSPLFEYIKPLSKIHSRVAIYCGPKLGKRSPKFYQGRRFEAGALEVKSQLTTLEEGEGGGIGPASKVKLQVTTRGE